MAEIRGGTKLEKVLAEMAANLTKAGTLKVGFLAGSRYPDGTPIAMVAAIQNYGAPRAGIPPRPFFTNMIKAKSPEWPAAIAGLLKANNYDAQLALDIAGMKIAEQLQQSIKDTNDPPLKPATIKRKGFAKPLIHHTDMINSVKHEVK